MPVGFPKTKLWECREDDADVLIAKDINETGESWLEKMSA